MKKKIFIINILLLIFLVFFSMNTRVYALPTDTSANKYSQGDQFKIVKDSYKYIYDKGWFNQNFKRDPDYPDYYFRVGEIVTYTGNAHTDGFWVGVYYMEVESSDGRKGYVHIANIEEYQLSRPSTIEDFIDKYNITTTSGNYSVLAKRNEEYYLNMSKLGLNAGVSVDNSRRIFNEYILTDYYNKETAKKNMSKRYNDILDIPVVDEDDSNFMLQANLYATIYCERDSSVVDNMDDPKKAFEEAEKIAKNGGDATAALNDMKEAVAKMEESGDYTEGELDDYYRRIDEVEFLVSQSVTEGMDKEDQELQQKIEDQKDGKSQVTYYKPTKDGTADSGQSLEDMMNDGDDFIASSDETVIEQEQLQDGISTLYNIFLEVGVAIAVIVGLIIGIKFMIGSVEEKAEIKKLLLPYGIGCLVVFGAFGIWKIVIEIMQSL